MGGSPREYHRNIENRTRTKNEISKAYAGECGSPLRAPAVNDEARGSGGTGDEGMKKVTKNI